MSGSCCLCSVVQGDEYLKDAQWCSQSGFLLFPCLTICNVPLWRFDVNLFQFLSDPKYLGLR